MLNHRRHFALLWILLCSHTAFSQQADVEQEKVRIELIPSFVSSIERYICFGKKEQLEKYMKNLKNTEEKASEVKKLIRLGFSKKAEEYFTTELLKVKSDERATLVQHFFEAAMGKLHQDCLSLRWVKYKKPGDPTPADGQWIDNDIVANYFTITYTEPEVMYVKKKPCTKQCQ